MRRGAGAGPSARRTLTRCSARSSGTTKTSMATGLPSSLVGTSGTYVTSRRLRRDHGLPTPKVDANDSARCSSAASASSNRFRRLTRVERQRVLRTSYVPTVVSSSTAALTVPAAHLVVNVDLGQCWAMSPEIDTATALLRRAGGLLVLVVLRCALDRPYPAPSSLHPDLVSGFSSKGVRGPRRLGIMGSRR